jgi:hypothetical protein
MLIFNNQTFLARDMQVVPRMPNTIPKVYKTLGIIPNIVISRTNWTIMFT